MPETHKDPFIYRPDPDRPLAEILTEVEGEPSHHVCGGDRYRIEHESAEDTGVRLAWGMVDALRAESAAHDPDEVFADVTEAVATVRRMPRPSSLTKHYGSIPAPPDPKSNEEIANIVVDERAERYRGRNECTNPEK